MKFRYELIFIFFETANFIKQPDPCSRRTEIGEIEHTNKGVVYRRNTRNKHPKNTLEDNTRLNSHLHLKTDSFMGTTIVKTISHTAHRHYSPRNKKLPSQN